MEFARYNLFFYSLYLSFFCFFFSSRRRHTRLQGDWSSDVCSSDLGFAHHREGFRQDLVQHFLLAILAIIFVARVFNRVGDARLVFRRFLAQLFVRSEERRVGKECRSRWAAEVYKKKSQS